MKKGGIMFSFQKGFARLTVLVSLLLFCPGTAKAADPDYPSKPVTLVVGFPAGGAIDLTARALVNGVKKHFPQPVIVENKGGAGGMVGLAQVAVKPPDGYTVGVIGSQAAAVAWHMGTTTYNQMEDFTHILRYAGLLFGIVVRDDSPFNTLQDVVKYAKANPGKVSFGTSGVGSTGHLAMVTLAQQAGNLQLTHIPYKGGGESIPALLGGHVEVLSDASSWASLVDAGKFRLLAVYSSERSRMYPSVPTVKETGYPVVYNSPLELFAPKGLPAPIAGKLHDSFRKAMDDPGFDTVLKKLGMPQLYLAGEELLKSNREDFERMKKVVEKLELQKK
jgi:tripartite-type tricarboxylate transporter receptor subunit TctC